jgi:hypothetical protein
MQSNRTHGLIVQLATLATRGCGGGIPGRGPRFRRGTLTLLHSGLHYPMGGLHMPAQAFPVSAAPASAQHEARERDPRLRRRHAMASRAVHVLVFAAFADREPAFALAELRRSGRRSVAVVGFDERPVTSMGGLRVTPERALVEVRPEDAELLILLGGDLWEGE